jgi:phosphoribosylanthranilate isomerase
MWIKICGIRDVETALAVAECRPQAIGLNFYERSPRAVPPALALEIVVRLPKTIEAVGLFVNHSAEQIHSICQKCDLGIVQLHGDEPPELLAELSAFRVIRAFRVGAEGLAEVDAYLERCAELDAMPWACLIDARVEGAFGGTGRRPPWEVIRQQYDTANWPPLVLAGGLRPENVAAAISAVHPWGVDVAGGVESQVACKDVSMVRKFVEAARAGAAG